MAIRPTLSAPGPTITGLAIRLLGEFSIQVAGQAIDLPSRAAQTLVAYLAIDPGVAHRREHLAGLLWPDSTETNARNNLRVALWRARKSIEVEPAGARGRIHASELTISIDLGPDDSVDVQGFDGPAGGETSDALIAVLSSYGGDLLPGFYDDWVILERQRLEAAFEARMTVLLDRLAAERRWDEIVLWGERWIALGQSPEPAYRALMVAHTGLGDMSRVAAVYRRCLHSLQSELGVSPADETNALFAWLTEGGDPAVVPVAAAGGSREPRAAAPDDEAAAPGDPPFVGLRSFDEHEADRFFGREELTAELIGRLGGHRFLAIVGASGSGKSSIVRAGVVPALRASEPWHRDRTAGRRGVLIMTPTAAPLQAMAAALLGDLARPANVMDFAAALERDPATMCRPSGLREDGPSVLVVDQFEELFTLTPDGEARRAFVRVLMHATSPACRHDVRVVIVLRADFYADCASDAGLRDAVAADQAFIGRMSAIELRQAIEAPAARGGWSFEPGLIDLILRDVGDEPGGLPLLSHALLETWQRRRGRTMTLRGYAESGGVRGAIARSADRLFNRRFSPAEQVIARGILLRLTELGAGSQATRRRASLRELIPTGTEGTMAKRVLDALVEARLVTVNGDTAEVAHEALITEWPALGRWLADDREGLQIHRHLTEAAQAWDGFDRDTDQVYRGARLAQALEWAVDRDAHMNPLEREYLEASRHVAARERSELAARQREEVDVAHRLAEAEGRRAEAAAAQGLAERRAARRLRQRAVYLAVALVVAVGLALRAGVLEADARQSAAAAIANEAAARVANGVALAANRVAQSRELAAAAISDLDVDPERSVLLALQAMAIDRTAEAEGALHRSLGTSRVMLTIHGSGPLIGASFSPDGTWIVTAGGGSTASLRDAVGGTERLQLIGHAGDVNSAEFSPDGSLIATASDDDTARVWDASTGVLLREFTGHTDGVARATFSPDGRRLATASIDGTAMVWEVATGKRLATMSGHTAGIRGVAWSPDGRRIATASRDGTARIWDATSGHSILELRGHLRDVLGVAWSPDGSRVATASSDNTAIVWDAGTGKRLLTLAGHTSVVQGIAFSPDGRWIATSSYDTTAKLWDAATGVERSTMAGHSGLVYGVAFSPDSSRVVTASEDGTARVWSLGPTGELPTIVSDAGALSDVAFSPASNDIMALVGSGRSATIWDLAAGRPLVHLVGHTGDVQSVAFSPDGRRIATASADHTARIWDAATGRELVVLVGHVAPDAPAFFPGVLDVVFSADGQRVATAGDDGTARIWDAATGRELLRLVGHVGPVGGVAFSPDGKRLATSGWDGTAIVWDAQSGERLVTLTGHGWIVRRIAFSPDGTRIATASFDGTAKIWDAGSGHLLSTLSGHTASIFGVAFSPDGTLVATASSDKTAKLWDVATGAELLTLSGHDQGLDGVAFSPDGTQLVTASEDGTARRYLMRADDLIAMARTRVTRDLTAAECQRYLHADACPTTVP